MQYYSRSPQELRNSVEQAKESGKKRRGNLILFADLVIIALILIFINQNPKILQKNNMPTVVKEKSFQWQGISFNAKCEVSSGCNLRWEGKPSVDIRRVRWELLRNGELLFSEAQQFKGTALNWEPASEITVGDQVYLKLLDTNREEMLQFRVHP